MTTWTGASSLYLKEKFCIYSASKLAYVIINQRILGNVLVGAILNDCLSHTAEDT